MSLRRFLESATPNKTVARKLPLQQLDSSWLDSNEGFRLIRSTSTKRLQRVMDIVLSVLSLIFLTPLSVLVSVAIALSMGFPVFFRQERVGLKESPFVLYKFRSMCRNAEQDTGPIWSQGAQDPRVTRFGRFLRRTRVDEIPQLWNVLKGDMSFVGPRPERPHFVETLKSKIPQYHLRFVVKPGLTGWGQINYKYGANEDDAVEKLRYDLYYIQEMSMGMNLLIIVRTFLTILFRPGS